MVAITPTHQMRFGRRADARHCVRFCSSEPTSGRVIVQSLVPTLNVLACVFTRLWDAVRA